MPATVVAGNAAWHLDAGRVAQPNRLPDDTAAARRLALWPDAHPPPELHLDLPARRPPDGRPDTRRAHPGPAGVPLPAAGDRPRPGAGGHRTRPGRRGPSAPSPLRVLPGPARPRPARRDD